MVEIITVAKDTQFAIPFEATPSFQVDEERFEKWEFTLPDRVTLTRFDFARGVSVDAGDYGDAILKVTEQNRSSSGKVRYVQATVEEVEILGTIDLEEADYGDAGKYKSNLNKYGYDVAGPSSTAQKLNSDF